VVGEKSGNTGGGKGEIQIKICANEEVVSEFNDALLLELLGFSAFASWLIFVSC
jgi:hypothetical protein